MLSEKEVWGNPSSFLPTAWWGAGMGTHGDRCLGGSPPRSSRVYPDLRCYMDPACRPGVPAGWLQVTQV